MENKKKYLLLKTAQEQGILPITSVCNLNCLFCSHKFNSPEIDTFKFGHLAAELIGELISYLPSEGPVILGESATRIIEGEPFSHPEIFAVLRKLRARWPERLIKIATGGSYLTVENVKKLAALGNIELNISLNCAGPEERVFLMSDPRPRVVFEGLSLLQKYNIKFNGSIVALPYLMGWQSITSAVEFLAIRGAATVRIFRPGFADRAPGKLQPPPDFDRDFYGFVKNLNTEYRVPIISEPPLLKDLTPLVAGTIPGSPSARAGIKRGDVIRNIGGERPLSRVDAFYRLQEAERPVVYIERDGQKKRLQLDKKGGQKPGLVVHYDLSGEVIKKLEDLTGSTEARNIALVTSRQAVYLMKSLLADFYYKWKEKGYNGGNYFEFKNENRKIGRRGNNERERVVKLLPVKNRFFGGNITAAGLLVNEDIINAIGKLPGSAPDLIILPRIIYDNYGNDLKGTGFRVLEEKFRTEVELI